MNKIINYLKELKKVIEELEKKNKISSKSKLQAITSNYI